MEPLYIVTGAAGHLGNTIIRLLKKEGKQIRGLILPTETGNDDTNITYYKGDVRIKETLEPLFEHTEGKAVIVIHTAGIVDISDQVSEAMYQVNVMGTKNMAGLAMNNHVSRFVYVSSVHAIPEKSKLEVLNEASYFSPDQVTGGYAKTKAEATQYILDSTKKGLNAVIVHPSGILGPYDTSGNHLVQLVNNYLQGRLPACVNGGYDFVDVRDVASGCLAAASRGRIGQCYILSNRHYEIRDILKMIRTIRGGRKVPTLPLWIARAAVPLLEGYAKSRKQRPLYTRYSLYTLSSNDRFSHDKATLELGYRPRDLYKTIQDTVHWLAYRSPKPRLSV